MESHNLMTFGYSERAPLVTMQTEELTPSRTLKSKVSSNGLYAQKIPVYLGSLNSQSHSPLDYTNKQIEHAPP